MQGGTIPNKITQTVSFFNTTGLIESEKNLYFVPRFSKHSVIAGTQVRRAYKNIFETVCPPSSVYTAINISSWSPQDRSLVIKGNIDDFRLVTEEGECLNYLILTRNVYSNESTYVSYYYAFFITNVRQEGGASIRVSISPDDFTNVYYLHNKKSLNATDISTDYTPFNDYMKNCYVERQHYNRVKWIPRTDHITGSELCTFPYSEFGALTTVILYTVPAGATVSNISFTKISELGTGSCEVVTRTTGGTTYVMAIGVSTVEGQDYVVELSYQFDLTYNTNVLIRDNLNLFMNPQESFPYRYQYRDLKYPLSKKSSLSNFSNLEMETIKNAESFEDITDADLKKKIILSSIGYYVVETKSLEGIPSMVENTTDEYKLTVGNNSGKITRPNVVLAFPFYYPPKELKKFNLRLTFSSQFSTTSDPSPIADGFTVSTLFSNSELADYILSAYVVRDICISENLVNISYDTLSIFDADVIFLGNKYSDGDFFSDNKEVYNLHEGLYVSGFATSFAHLSDCKLRVNSANSVESENCVIGLLVSLENKTYREMNIIINNKEIPNLVSNFFDPFIEQQPYDFYSVSSLSSYEMVFDKSRYYETNKIQLNYYVSINEGIKIGLIPIYNVEGKETEYFNEGMTYSMASSMPLASSSYASYYAQNKAQMKNQYAISNVNFASSLLNNIISGSISSIGGTLAGAIRGAPDPLASFTSGASSSVKGTTEMYSNVASTEINQASNLLTIRMNQKSKLADVGNMPDSIKQTGSNVFYDSLTNEMGFFLNHYTIDTISKNSICKLLERIGYLVNIYDIIHTNDRVGYNYVKIQMFDWNSDVNIMSSQESSLRTIFAEGVTMVHNKSFLTSGHNYETILE